MEPAPAAPHTPPRRKAAYLAPSMLSADHGHLAEQVALVQEYAGALHLDFMDGHFVPTLGFAPAVVGALRRVCDLQLRCHLMVQAPEQQVEVLGEEGAHLIIAHAECGERAHRALRRGRELGMKSGLALKLDTPVSIVEEHLDALDVVLVMSIVPGWSGQPFKEQALARIAELREMIDRRGLPVELEVDGGINEHSAASCVAAGATVLAAATAIFQAADPEWAARELAAVAAGPH